MKIEVNIEKKYFFIILGVILLIGGILTGYAYSNSSGNPQVFGHSLNEIQGYFTGDNNLQTSLGKFCESDGTNCTINTIPGSSVDGHAANVTTYVLEKDNLCYWGDGGNPFGNTRCYSPDVGGTIIYGNCSSSGGYSGDSKMIQVVSGKADDYCKGFGLNGANKCESSTHVVYKTYISCLKLGIN